MLNSMREGQGAKIVKFTALGFVLAATVGMVFMDVGGFFRGGLTGSTVLASIGRTRIDQPTFERAADPALRQQNMTLEEAYRFGLLKTLLDELVTREAMRQEANQQGLVVGRGDIAEKIHELIKLQVQPGETPQQALTRILQAQGLNENDLVNNIRQEATTRLIEAPLRASANFMPRVTAEALGRYQGERRDIVFFTVTPEGAARDLKADDDTLKAYYETVKDQYQIPEERTFKALVLSADDVKNTVKISDADVRAAFDERKDQFRVGERRRIEQVVLNDEAKAKAAAESARKGKALRSTAPDSYREPADIEQTGLPAELGTAVFGAQKGTVLNPIKTPLGWHVIKVMAVVPARTQNFNEVQADLRKELESDALHTEMESRISKTDELLGSGSSLEQVAADLGLAIRTVGPIDRQGNVAAAGEKADPLLTTLAQNKDVLNGLFELMEGENGDLSEINETTYAAFALESVRPTRDRDFAEIRNDIEKKWLEEQRNDALQAQVEKLSGEISRGEKAFEEAAKESGVVVKTARDVSRESKVAGLNDPVALTRLFDETDFKAVVKVPTENGTILAKVLDARIPDAGAGRLTPEQENQLRTQMQMAIVSLFITDLRERHDVEVHEDRLEKVYGAGQGQNQ